MGLSHSRPPGGCSRQYVRSHLAFVFQFLGLLRTPSCDALGQLNGLLLLPSSQALDLLMVPLLILSILCQLPLPRGLYSLRMQQPRGKVGWEN